MEMDNVRFILALAELAAYTPSNRTGNLLNEMLQGIRKDALADRPLKPLLAYVPEEATAQMADATIAGGAA